MSSQPIKPVDATVPANEEPILQSLLGLRRQLSSLKRDRSSYLKSSDVNEVYERVIDQIRLINAIRTQPDRVNEQNRLDVILDDLFQMLSLSFLTVGLTKAAPASYASLSTVRRLLEHLKESGIYTEGDIHPIRERLGEISANLKRASAEESESAEVLQLVERKLARCQLTFDQVEKSLVTTSPELAPVINKLIGIKRRIMAVRSKPKFEPNELKPLRDQIRDFEASRVDGFFVMPDGSIPEGQNVAKTLLEDCHCLINDFMAHGDQVDPSLHALYKQLIDIKSTLENLLVTHRWTLRETDLYYYQKQLRALDDLRVNGIFLPKDDSSTNNPPPSDKPLSGQSILLYLLRRCYAIIYKLLESSEPVSEALIPIHNQLTTVRRCLLEVKRMGGLSSARELYPYQMKLASIDNLRVDGKFMVGDSVPEGQGMLNALLAECFDICHELKVEMVENEANEEEDDDEDDEEDDEDDEDDDDDDDEDDDDDDEDDDDNNDNSMTH